MAGIDSAHEKPPIFRALALLIGAAGFMAAFFGFFKIANIPMPSFGLVFLVYWAAILKQDLIVFLPSVIGGVAGIALAWLLVAILSPMGPAGAVTSLLTVAGVLFCFMRGHCRLIVNNALMLYLTLATIEELNVAKNIFSMLLSLMIGASYIGITTIIVNKLRDTRKRNS